MTNSLRFDKDKIRILQVSDPQDLKYVRVAMTEMLDKAYDAFEPDLVVFTGDNILGNHLLDKRFGSKHFAEGIEATEKSMKQALEHILEPVQRRKIPFAMIYGNHDDMNLLTKDEQMEIYRSYSYCLEGNTNYPEVDCDTYAVKIYSGEKLVYVLYMLDSAWQDNDGERKCHTEIKPETVKWFVETNKAIKKENGNKAVPALMFIHIPLPAQKELTEPCSPNDSKAVIDFNGKACKLNPCIAKGVMAEPISDVDTDNGLFDAVLSEGNVKAIITGHDHRNCFEGTYKGVKFLQTGCASFRCYGTKEARGVRVIDINSDGSFDTQFYNYFDICGNSLKSKIKFFLDSDENEKKKLALICSLAGTSAVSVAAATVKIIKFIKAER